jgi:hypothetical protein
MNKKKSPKATVLHFPDRTVTEPATPTVHDRVDAIQKMLANVRYDSISRKRTMLLCDAINHAFREDAFGLEAVLTLIRAVADPKGDPEKFTTAQTAIQAITIENLAAIL